MPDDSAYQRYIPKAERERIARRHERYIPEAERKRIATREKTERAVTKKQHAPKTKEHRPSKAAMKKAAEQATVRRTNLVVRSFAVVGLSALGLWAAPKFNHQPPAPTSTAATTTHISSAPATVVAALVVMPYASVSSAPRATAIVHVPAPQIVPTPHLAAAPKLMAPQTHIVSAPKAKEDVLAPVAVLAVRSDVAKAQEIINKPMTPAEFHAKPFFDRMHSNPEMMGLIRAVSATTGTSVPRLMEVMAAETSGRPGNPLQVTPRQFPQLVGAYGPAYANQMNAYADTLHGAQAHAIRVHAKELQYLSQYMTRPDGQIHFDMDSDAYDKQMHKIHGKKSKHFPTLAQRIDKLYQNEYVRTGMQALSNNHDIAKVAALPRLSIAPDSKKVFETPRSTNLFGLTSLVNIFKHNYSDDQPVAGTLMSNATAIANHAAYHVKIKELTVNGRVLRKVISTKDPITIGEFKQKQLMPWVGAEEGFQGQLQRAEAKHLLMSQGTRPIIEPQVSSQNKPNIG